MIKSILIPTDGSANSKIALEYGIYLAEKFNAEINGLNVIDIRALEGPFFSDVSGSLGFIPYQNYLPKFQEMLEERGALVLENFVKSCEDRGIHPNIKRLTGVIPNIIAEEVKKVDLLIMAQRGEHAQWSTGLLGSTTESVVRKSLRPVLITPQQFRPLEKVVITYDGSAEANKALKLACEFVYSLKLHLDVVIVNNHEERGREIAAEAEEFLRPYHVDANVTVVTGEPYEEILNYADCNAIDLIVMGAFGHSRMRELLLGSTTAYILRKSTLPVLLSR